MVKNRHAPSGIPEIRFAAPAGIAAGMEVVGLGRLRERTAGGVLGALQRPTFHHVLTVRTGVLRYTVDFTAHDLSPGSWLWVRPGQVQQWGDPSGAEGTLVLFRPDFLGAEPASAARLDDPYAPVLLRPAGDEHRRLTAALGHLAATFDDPGRLPLDAQQDVLRHLLAAFVLRLAHAGPVAGAPAPAPADAFLRFRDAVERRYASSRRLEEYARLLGYSARTLSRATQAAAGVNAKEFIDRRVVLEARRLLAHGDDTASRVATRLGFSSATNFSKYFHQRTGVTPIAFRESVRAGVGGDAVVSAYP
ncbi:AraC family transcriptional regulator [Actinoplanes sp. NBRC 101535]|uniref:helix-turn-helix domain-containing protein n=1 Tax=Actinoplanes sp. NBRC 101535 TaxID=3032196 RepID=UPI0024A5CFEC|nr:AraC family transcriptional regulator [Actinoplanes sp. NBRC 101535]GLY06662.1 transcriptional regulator [Actinoplanes sp. NBRC 101535]